MKIISWNVNGLRAVFKKGFMRWLNQLDADVVCLQETRALRGQVHSELAGSPQRDGMCTSWRLSGRATRESQC